MSKQLERHEYPDNYDEKATESAFNDLMLHRKKHANKALNANKSRLISPNLLGQDKLNVRKTGHSFMFGTGMPQINIELPNIKSESMSPAPNGYSSLVS